MKKYNSILISIVLGLLLFVGFNYKVLAYDFFWRDGLASCSESDFCQVGDIVFESGIPFKFIKDVHQISTIAEPYFYNQYELNFISLVGDLGIFIVIGILLVYFYRKFLRE